jgi:hypothetical protein
MRKYGQWAGNEKGIPEDTTRCIEEIWPGTRTEWLPHQCRRKRGYGLNGLYCKQHAKKEKG